MDKVEAKEFLTDWIARYKDVAERNALAEEPDESAEYLISQLFEPQPDLTDEQRTGIKEGINARKEGRVRPWEDIRAELSPDQSGLLTEKQAKIKSEEYAELAEKWVQMLADKDAECQARIEALIKWGMEVCNEHYRGRGVFTRRECPECWKSLAKYSKEEADD